MKRKRIITILTYVLLAAAWGAIFVSLFTACNVYEDTTVGRDHPMSDNRCGHGENSRLGAYTERFGRILKKQKTMRRLKRWLALCAGIAMTSVLTVACDENLNIQQRYGFTLETMPVQKRLGVGETAEIRCTLVREGEYDEARYTIRYFQPDGDGELRMDDGTVFLPNDRYPLERTPLSAGTNLVPPLLHIVERGSAGDRRLCRGQYGTGRSEELHVPE